MNEKKSTESKTYLKKIANLARNNKVAKLKELLAKLKTKLNGHVSWNYYTDKLLVECAARDAILAGHEEIVRLLFDAGLSANDMSYIDDNNHGIEKLIYFAVKSGNLNMVKLLVEYGAKIYSAKNDGPERGGNNI